MFIAVLSSSYAMDKHTRSNHFRHTDRNAVRDATSFVDDNYVHLKTTGSIVYSFINSATEVVIH